MFTEVCHTLSARFQSLTGCGRPARAEVTPDSGSLSSPSQSHPQLPPTRVPLSQQAAAPAEQTLAPRTQPAASAWDRLKAGVLKAALVTAAAVVAMLALAVPVTWLLVGAVGLGVAVAHGLTAIADAAGQPQPTAQGPAH
ncbi:hypothetical protein ACT80S_06830 [Ramlibacter sp. MAHUQ-53]|uniref:hypothetical protein n=1 Tax=unclassified Ramlibacter TaxID=2617605 RepID=UPI003640FBBE